MVSRATASSSGRPLAAERVANSRLRFSSDVVMCDHSLDECDHTTRASQRRSSRGIRQGALAYAALHASPKPARGAPNTELSGIPGSRRKRAQCHPELRPVLCLAFAVVVVVVTATCFIRLIRTIS